MDQQPMYDVKQEQEIREKLMVMLRTKYRSRIVAFIGQVENVYVFEITHLCQKVIVHHDGDRGTVYFNGKAEDYQL